jgi:tRNA (pseudouridine54-N1)-methyltransferase
MATFPVNEIQADPFKISKKNFIIIAHRAVSDGSINLKDLCGASGRWDGIARSITSTLFLSHDMRRDTSLHVLLMGPGDPPKILSIDGGRVKYLNPDERACSALMKKNLGIKIGEQTGRSVLTSPGIRITRGDLSTLLSRLGGKSILLNEGGIPLRESGIERYMNERVNFILSDDQEFRESELEIISNSCNLEVSLGPLSLHSYQAIIVIHHYFDMLEEAIT